jgi:hypothetical protein
LERGEWHYGLKPGVLEGKKVPAVTSIKLSEKPIAQMSKRVSEAYSKIAKTLAKSGPPARHPPINLPKALLKARAVK